MYFNTHAGKASQTFQKNNVSFGVDGRIHL